MGRRQAIGTWHDAGRMWSRRHEADAIGKVRVERGRARATALDQGVVDAESHKTGSLGDAGNLNRNFCGLNLIRAAQPEVMIRPSRADPTSIRRPSDWREYSLLLRSAFSKRARSLRSRGGGRTIWLSPRKIEAQPVPDLFSNGLIVFRFKRHVSAQNSPKATNTPTSTKKAVPVTADTRNTSPSEGTFMAILIGLGPVA